MSQLPKYVPGQGQLEYLDRLVKVLGEELDRRPARQPQDGVLYLSSDVPVRLISANGTVYQLSVSDTGVLETTEVTL